MVSVKQFLYLLRLSHWSKSAFVFLGVLYSGSIHYLPDALIAAFGFCLIASAVYIYNDIQDIEDDKLHPHKCLRPLASGDVSLDFAVGMLAVLLLSAIVLAWTISSTLAAIYGAYLLVNLAYNHFLKNLPVLDVLSIASGFMLRVLAGTIGIGLPISWWLTLTATLLSLLIALAKRRLEKQLGLKYQTRMVLRLYSLNILDLLIIGTAVGCFLAYLAYTIIARDESFYFILTLPFAAFGLWRFSRLSMKENHTDDPISIFFHDSLSRFNLLCFLLLTMVALSPN